MKVIRLSDNKEFIEKYYKYIKKFFEIDDDRDNKKTKQLISNINKYNSALCAKIQLLFFLYKYQKDDSAKQELEKHLNFYKRSLNINDI